MKEIVCLLIDCHILFGGSRGRDRMVVGFITTNAISAYHHLRCEFRRGILDATLCDKVCQ